MYFIIILSISIIYFFPSILLNYKNGEKFLPDLILNALLGWTGIVWYRLMEKAISR